MSAESVVYFAAFNMDVFESFRALYTPTTIATTTALFFSAFLLYRWLLPAPIAGIPFNAEATKSIFGDVPSMMAHLKTHETIIDWIECHNTRHNSPIVQVFANLFGRPWVVIKDFRESQVGKHELQLNELHTNRQ